jgi:hypothetical protein
VASPELRVDAETVARAAEIHPGALCGWRHQPPIGLVPVSVASERGSAGVAGPGTIEIAFATGAWMRIGERGRYGDDNGGGCPAGRFLIASGMRVWIATTGRRGVHHQVHSGLVARIPKSQVARRRPFWVAPALFLRNLASRLDSPQASRHSFPMLDSRILRRSRSEVQLN